MDKNMTLERFQIIQKAITRNGSRRAGRTAVAARMVLVDGISRPEAALACSVNRGGLHRLLKKFGTYTVCNECKHAHSMVDT